MNLIKKVDFSISTFLIEQREIKMLKELQALLLENDIKIIYLDVVEKGFYYPEARTIFMNEEAYNATLMDFRVAHELGHFLKRHSEYAPLYSKPTHRAKLEKEANIFAISFLVQNFINNELTDISQFIVDRFMDFYTIPKKLRDLCVAVCSDYFNKVV